MTAVGEEVMELAMITVQVTSKTKRAIYRILRADTHPHLSDWLREAIREKIESDGKKLGMDFKDLLAENSESSTANSSNK